MFVPTSVAMAMRKFKTVEKGLSVRQQKVAFVFAQCPESNVLHSDGGGAALTGHLCRLFFRGLSIIFGVKGKPESGTLPLFSKH